ncbi:early estrogen-induced gene 1 protein-like isoform X2 [Engraulis encrasicolus]
MDHGRFGTALLQANAFVRKQLCTHSFSVSLFLDELANVPRVTGWLFCKVRLLDGSYKEETESNEVFQNTVQWRKEFVFQCRATVNGSTGVLGSCICRVSVRKDKKGGKCFDKVGYVDLNLVEFIGSGYVTRHCLLEGYSGKHSKSDNSFLKVRLHLQLLEGDPCFRVPVQPAVSTTSVTPVGRSLSTSPLNSLPIMVADELLTHLPEIPSGSVEDTLNYYGHWTNEDHDGSLRAEYYARLAETRVDAWEVVDSLCREILGSLELQHPTNDAGLALYVSEDGSTTLGVSPKDSR